MFEFLAFLMGSAAVESKKRYDAIKKAKANGKPYYFYNGKAYSIETDEPLTRIGRSFMGVHSHKIVYSPVDEDLRKTNEKLKRDGYKFHYEIDYESSFHCKRNGYIKVENSTGMTYKIEFVPWVFRRTNMKDYEYKFCHVDRITGEPIDKPKWMKFKETMLY